MLKIVIMSGRHMYKISMYIGLVCCMLTCCVRDTQSSGEKTVEQDVRAYAVKSPSPALGCSCDPDAGATIVLNHVYDGDTIYVDFPCWPQIIRENVRLRIRGIDTPELHDRRPNIKAIAQKGKEFVTNALSAAGNIFLVHDMTRDKYFGIDADVLVGGKDLGTELLKAGLAKLYTGVGAKPWQ